MRALPALRATPVVLLLTMLAACAGKPVMPEVEHTPAAAPAPPAPAAPAKPAAAPDPRRITVAAVGDMMLGTDYPKDHLPDDDGMSFLAEVAAWLQPADITFGNLEGVLADGGVPAKRCSKPDACFLFRSPTRYARHFADAGFDVLSLANNHARDFGEDGRSATMQAVAGAGMRHSGRLGDFATLERNGLKIAIMAFAVTRESNLLHDYAVSADAVRAYAADHDIVIVSFHGGAEGHDVTHLPFAEEEYFGEPRGDVVRFARLMVEAGADLVLGHGPHVVRAMERYQDRLIAYSLGNFATYYGISVAGLKGIAPILEVQLDAAGRFIDGRIVSTVQVRPGGPRPDPAQQALHLIAELSAADFRDPGLAFDGDGRVRPRERQYLRPTPAPAASR